jgi:hypothetical protein
MSQPFPASRLRRSPSFRRLTGVSVATFERMLGQLREPWDSQERRKLKPADARRRWAGLRTIC